MKMVCVEVVVTKIIDLSQPFWVECKLEDVYGKEHIFQDKMPIFFKKDVTEADLPVYGKLRRVIIGRDEKAIRIDTSKPDGVESKLGQTIFDVSLHQLK